MFIIKALLYAMLVIITTNAETSHKRIIIRVPQKTKHIYHHHVKKVPVYIILPEKKLKFLDQIEGYDKNHKVPCNEHEEQFTSNYAKQYVAGTDTTWTSDDTENLDTYKVPKKRSKKYFTNGERDSHIDQPVEYISDHTDEQYSNNHNFVNYNNVRNELISESDLNPSKFRNNNRIRNNFQTKGPTFVHHNHNYNVNNRRPINYEHGHQNYHQPRGNQYPY